MENFIIKTPPGPIPEKDGIGCEYFRCMKKFKDNIAQHIADTGEDDTYGDLLSRCIRTAIKLRSKNLPKDAFISICSKNHKDSVVPFIASVFINLKFCAADPTLPLDETIYLFEQVAPSLIFVEPESIDLIEKAIQKVGKNIEIVVFGESDKYETFSEYLKPSEEEERFKPVEVNYKDTIVIFFSSGTTGLPKGICLNSCGILGQAQNFINNGIVRGTILTYSTFYWISSIIFLSISMLLGIPRVIASKFDPAQTWLLIDKYKISSIFVTPYTLNHIIKVGKPAGVTGNSMKNLLSAGGPTTIENILEAKSLLPHCFVKSAYGQTEMSGNIFDFNTFNDEDKKLLEEKPNSCGRPIHGIYYKVVDPETERILGPSESGELRVLSEYCMNGYHNKDSSEAYDSDGWLRTGDVVYYDQDFCFYVVDRIKEMLTFEGWQIAPATVESVVYQHPAVHTAVVIGIPHDVDGHHLMAVVILKSECEGDVTSDEILEFANARLSHRYKLRAGVKLVKEVPISPSRKIRRHELRTMILSDMKLGSIKY